MLVALGSEQRSLYKKLTSAHHSQNNLRAALFTLDGSYVKVLTAILNSILPKKSTLAQAIVGPAVRPAVQGFLNPTCDPTDSFTPSQEKDPVIGLVAKGAGVAAGTVAGLATTAVCATQYPIAAICVGTATCAAVLNSDQADDLPVSKPVAALGAGILAAAYAPAVAGAVVAVGTEELVTDQVEKFLSGRKNRP